jgi:hypothetical protein
MKQLLTVAFAVLFFCAAPGGTMQILLTKLTQ